MNSYMKSEPLYHGNFLDMNLVTMTNSKGKEIKWECVSRKNKTNAVVIVPYHIQKKKFVYISEFRIPINGHEICFPAGLLDKENESFEDTVARELKEETGLELVKIRRVSPKGYNSAGMTDEAVSIVYADVNGELSNKFQEDTEDIRAFLMSKEEIRYLLKMNVKWGSKAWIISDMLVNGNPFS